MKMEDDTKGEGGKEKKRIQPPFENAVFFCLFHQSTPVEPETILLLVLVLSFFLFFVLYLLYCDRSPG